jgi:hypothetical protein
MSCTTKSTRFCDGQELVIDLGLVNVRHDLMNGFFVKIERARHIVEDADVVNDQTEGLLLPERAIGAANCLHAR